MAAVSVKYPGGGASGSTERKQVRKGHEWYANERDHTGTTTFPHAPFCFTVEFAGARVPDEGMPDSDT